MSAIRRMMMKAKKPKFYINIYKSMFPSNGTIDSRNSFFIYLKETIPIGTKVHLALTFTVMDSSITSLGIRDTAASPYDIFISMPKMSFDIEFETKDRKTNILWCYFDKSVTNMQIDMSSVQVEKIVDDPYINYVKIRTRNNTGGRNCLGCATSYVEQMLVDGEQVTPTLNYDFGDSDFHNVFILFKDPTTIPDGALYNGNYSVTHKDIPACVTKLSDGAIRGSGASEKCHVVIRATTMPTIGNYNFVSWTVGNLYVPSNLITDYTNASGLASSKIHPIEEFPYSF